MIRQFSLDFKKISDLVYFCLYLQHILGASKSGKLDDPLASPPLLKAGPLKKEPFLRCTKIAGGT